MDTRDNEIAGVHRSLDTGDLIITGVQPGNAVESRLDVTVFILVFKAAHRRFTCCQCPNLNLRKLSESQSDALRIHVGNGLWQQMMC